MFEQIPDHSTISQLRRQKPAFRKVFRRLFEKVVRQCVEKGLVSGRIAATGSTHVKAHASRASEYKLEAEEEAGNYWERLDADEADSAYDFLLVHRVLEGIGIDFFVVPQPAHDRTKAELKRDAFTYDEKPDIYRCPNGKELLPKRLYRSGNGLFWEY